MVGFGETEREPGKAPIQIITGHDGQPAFAVLPFEVLAVLLAYARKGRKAISVSANEDASVVWHFFPGLLAKEVDRSAERLTASDSDRSAISELEKYLKSMFSEERMDEFLNNLADCLESARNPRPTDDDEDAADVALYDAAKARKEESFPAEVARRLIAGDHPVKVFREHRGLTQRELAERVRVRTAYLSQIETKRRDASVRLLRRLAESLGVEASDLI